MIIRTLHLAALKSVTRAADQVRNLQFALVDPEGETGGPCAVATTGTILISVPVEFPEGAPEGMRIFRPHKPAGRRTAEIEIHPTELQDRVTPLRKYRTVIAPHGRDTFRVVFHEHPGVLCVQAARNP